MDKLVLNSKLPEELVDLIMAFKPRDRDMKSPTAALVKAMMGFFEGKEHPFFWNMRKSWYASSGWLSYARMFQLGQYSESYWNFNVF